MAHKHKHSHNLSQEVIVWNIFWVVIIAYFLLQLFLSLDKSNLLGAKIFSTEGLSQFWQVLVFSFQKKISPIFIGLDIALFGIFAWSLISVWPIKPKFPITRNPHAHGHAGSGNGAATSGVPATNPAILKHWTDVVRRANTGTPENLRWAIMESDALVDLVLKQRELIGETMADRLAHFRRDDYKTIDRLWEAHKLRNEIAHTPGFRITAKASERALFAYRDFLKEIKAF